MGFKGKVQRQEVSLLSLYMWTITQIICKSFKVVDHVDLILHFHEKIKNEYPELSLSFFILNVDMMILFSRIYGSSIKII